MIYNKLKKGLLKSSSYTLCITTAFSIVLLYLYHIYYNVFLLEWNLYGMIFFTLHEYLSHRFILHYTHDGIIYYYLHGKHHLQPYGHSIHIPILYSSIVHIFYFYITTVLFTYTAAINFMNSYQLCYILFEHIHKETHHPYMFKNEQPVMFRTYHMYHHIHNKHRAYSFSVPIWDILFGTFPENLKYNLLAFIPIPIISFLGITQKSSLHHT